MPEWRLYRSRDLPGQWVGTDQAGALMLWPAEKRTGWAKRVGWTKGTRGLEEVAPALAKGTGWPGGGRAHHPRSATGLPSKPFTFRATEEERALWESAAKHLKRTLSKWCRDELTTAAKRVMGSEAARSLSRQR